MVLKVGLSKSVLWRDTKIDFMASVLRAALKPSELPWTRRSEFERSSNWRLVFGFFRNYNAKSE